MYERIAQTDLAELTRLAAGITDTSPPSRYERIGQTNIAELQRLAEDQTDTGSTGGYERIGSIDVDTVRRKLSSGSTVVSATSYTMTGPSTGVSGVASTNFTVTLTPEGGVVTGTATITPSDGGGGGTFTPTTVGLTTAAPSTTFTYTPASAGAKTISATNDKSLTNPANLTYTATAASPSDNFNRADGGLGANWTTDSNIGHALTIVSNACKGTTASQHNVSVYTASGTLAANQYAQCKVATTGAFFGPVVRGNSAGTFYTGYYPATSGTRATIFKWIAGVGTQIDGGGGTLITVTANDVVYFEAVGTALTMKVNGVTVCTATDSAITAAGYTGIDIYDVTAGAVDDFVGGAL